MALNYAEMCQIWFHSVFCCFEYNRVRLRRDLHIKLFFFSLLWRWIQWRRWWSSSIRFVMMKWEHRRATWTRFSDSNQHWRHKKNKINYKYIFFLAFERSSRTFQYSTRDMCETFGSGKATFLLLHLIFIRRRWSTGGGKKRENKNDFALWLWLRLFG